MIKKQVSECSDAELKAAVYDHIILKDNAAAVIDACHKELQKRALAEQSKLEEPPKADVNE